jgi:hypothetical protein
VLQLLMDVWIGERELRTTNGVAAVVDCDDFDSETFDFFEQRDNYFFREEESVESEAKLYSAVTKWAFGS